MTKPSVNTLLAIFSLLLGAGLPGQAAAEVCGAPATAIHQIQGSGPASPLTGQKVTVEGILTQDSRHPGGFGGFYLQQADAETDQNPATSEALFIYTRLGKGKPGQRLRLSGTVKEYHGLTELVDIRTLKVCGDAPLPAPIDVSLPWSQPPESLENMRVRFTGPLTVIDHYNLTVFGELTLAATDQVTPTEYLPPGKKAARQRQQNHQHRVVLDDGKAVRNPDPVPWPPAGLAHPNTVRAGDTVAGIEGVLDFRFGQWRVQPSSQPSFKRVNARPQPPARAPKPSYRVMTLNLENYFNGDGQGGGFPTARGAANRSAFQQQSQRLVAAILEPDPDILAVTEMENDGYGPHSALAELTRQLGADWAFIATPGRDGSDAIRNAVLYRSDRVIPIGDANRPDTGRASNLGRPPIAQVFHFPGHSHTVRVVVAHLKSKSCRNAHGADSDQNDGQGCFNHQRTQSAKAMLDWLNSLPPPEGFAGNLITGDLNSYAKEDPIQVLVDGGYTSLVHHFHPCDGERCNHHSYRYRGEKGSLDYALASGTLTPNVQNAQSWNINADEPRALGYGQAHGHSVRGPWRSSDHNPVITDLNFQTP
ncbi:ExeM/NucH family extracellular endonuclease [Marinobacter sp.]|uniref:ExeM/NucH family extracellular endonuclease n=1 Tax=Marinobacter sp. TaxID=50741 RepID=UPI001A04779F|nr:ExeM/NucH family extracellular endonuclease [Marinobacter sp.]MBE0486605.1 ExeM/NucH family extracellular endonuclease [Marinobacter sp.]